MRGSDAAALIEMINALPENGDIDVSADLGLGFRGFVLRGLALPGDANQVRVLGSQVVVSRGHAIGTLRTDADREIFTMLGRCPKSISTRTSCKRYQLMD